MPDNPSSLSVASALDRPLVHESEPPGTFTKFNDLPLEIQRNIFVIAYYLEEGDWELDWVYVASKVREW